MRCSPNSHPPHSLNYLNKTVSLLSPRRRPPRAQALPPGSGHDDSGGGGAGGSDAPAADPVDGGCPVVWAGATVKALGDGGGATDGAGREGARRLGGEEEASPPLPPWRLALATAPTPLLVTGVAAVALTGAWAGARWARRRGRMAW